MVSVQTTEQTAVVTGPKLVKAVLFNVWQLFVLVTRGGGWHLEWLLLAQMNGNGQKEH
jgi:hypothetical protein